LIVSYSNSHNTGPYSSSLASVAYLPFSSFVDHTTQVSMLNDLDTDLAAARSKLLPADKATYPIVRKWLGGNDVAALEFLIFPRLSLIDSTRFLVFV
jgi:hypothetical protein